MNVDLGGEDLRSGLLGLVVALAEIIKETLRLQALRRMEAGSLTEDEVERLGKALMDLDQVFEQLKLELGVSETVRTVRASLDRAVEDLLSSIVESERPQSNWSLVLQ